MSSRIKSIRIVAAFVGSIVLLSATVAGAQDGQVRQEAQRLNIGRTGIQCVRLPCPHRGIFLPGAANMQGLHRMPLYADLDGSTFLPKLIASESDKARLEQAWDRRQCLEIRGNLQGRGDNAVLEVSRIIGPCR